MKTIKNYTQMIANYDRSNILTPKLNSKAYCIRGSRIYFFNPILLEVFVISDKIVLDALKSSFELIWDNSK